MKTPIQIRFSDVDMARHVHNAVYLHWFELARMALLREVVPPVNDWRTEGLILAHNEIVYARPVHLNDTIEAEAWCSKVGTKSFEISYAIHRIDNHAGICATGKCVMVSFNYVVNATIALPNDWRVALEKIVRK